MFEFQDMLIIGPPVKKSLVLRISLVAFVMVCGVFMCSIGLKQISNFTKAGFIDAKVVEQHCEVPVVEKWERSYVHFPKPTTFSRYAFSFVVQISFFPHINT
ncbi:hypothetical protein HanLR1_Chr05g0179691 [Helianthus annuus]|nr:hypothetical protein HanLR1_Chr05g0179691 [Helianthus annuus]